MLVNTASDLDAMRTNQSGTYALGTKITLDPNQPFTPIPNFTGLFDGQATSDHRQPDDRIHDPERWTVRHHCQRG